LESDAHVLLTPPPSSASGGHKKLDEAVRTLLKHGAPAPLAHLPLYRELSRRILSRSKKQEADTDQASVVADLRTVLYGLRSRMNAKEVGELSYTLAKQQRVVVLHQLQVPPVESTCVARRAD
jgi:hypothetical protein